MKTTQEAACGNISSVLSSQDDMLNLSQNFVKYQVVDGDVWNNSQG